MDKRDIEKIEKIVADRKIGHSNLLKSSEVYRMFNHLDESTYKDKNLEKKYKELIGLGISIFKNCEPCMEWHIHEALKGRATREQIIEAIEVGIEMGGGPASVSSRFALMVLEYYTNDKISKNDDK
ncbi:MAG: carboxymuconolactone decarboxylase family protein [Bacteroidota bacterium]